MSKAKVVEVKRGRGRPVIETTVGYKIKCGLRYATDGAEMTTRMSEGAVFTEAAANRKITKLTESGQIRVWGGRVRAELVPNKGTTNSNVISCRNL